MLKAYLARFKGQGRSPPTLGIKWIIWSWVGGFIGITSASWINHWLTIDLLDRVLLIGSFGASAVLIYGTPHVQYAQPRNLVGGHIICALVGVTVSHYLPFSIEIVAASAVATAIVLMHLTNTIHPPGGATAIIAVIGSQSIQDLGYMYVLQPVLSGIAMMLIVALLINNLSADQGRHYPKFWY